MFHSILREGGLTYRWDSTFSLTDRGGTSYYRMSMYALWIYRSFMTLNNGLYGSRGCRSETDRN